MIGAEPSRIQEEVAQERLERDAARYRFLREMGALRAQAFFWNYPSRRQRDEAIDRAMKQQQSQTGGGNG